MTNKTQPSGQEKDAIIRHYRGLFDEIRQLVRPLTPTDATKKEIIDKVAELVANSQQPSEDTERLKQELERERMCHAACGVIAMSNTPESLDTNSKMHPDYLSASVQDCIRAAEREIALRKAIHSALNELGVPSGDYPAPVANAVGILREAIDAARGATEGKP